MAVTRYAVVGATGLVGEYILAGLLARGETHIEALASERSTGKTMVVQGKSWLVKNTLDFDFSSVDVVFLAVSETCARALMPRLRQHACWVIDKSAAHRHDPAVPLVIPELHAAKMQQAIHQGQRVFASPNCVATPLSMALAPLHAMGGMGHVNVSTYQSVSGSGRQALSALSQESQDVLAHKKGQATYYEKPIGFNCMPWIDCIDAQGESGEEEKIRREVSRILDYPSWSLQATAVRVPSFACHGMSVSVYRDQAWHIDEVLQAWQAQAGLQYVSPDQATAVDAVGQDDVFVTRARVAVDHPTCLSFWCITDNLRKGAATQALQINACIQSLCQQEENAYV